jgi:hypothetical protein
MTNEELQRLKAIVTGSPDAEFDRIVDSQLLVELQTLEASDEIRQKCAKESLAALKESISARHNDYRAQSNSMLRSLIECAGRPLALSFEEAIRLSAMQAFSTLAIPLIRKFASHTEKASARNGWNEVGATSDLKKAQPERPSDHLMNDPSLAREPISQETREWVRKELDEADVIADLRELSGEGGRELHEFIRDLENIVDA